MQLLRTNTRGQLGHGENHANIMSDVFVIERDLHKRIVCLERDLKKRHVYEQSEIRRSRCTLKVALKNPKQKRTGEQARTLVGEAMKRMGCVSETLAFN